MKNQISLRIVLWLMLLCLSQSVQAQAPTFLYVPLDAPKTGGTIWYGINNKGTIVGQVLDTNTGLWTAAFYQDGAFSEVSMSNTTWSTLYSVRDNGMSVGTYSDTNGISHGFTRATDGTLTFLPDVEAGGNTIAGSLDNAGTVIVGEYTSPTNSNYTGFIYQRGKYKSFMHRNGTTTYLEALRSPGLIAGEYIDASGTIHSFLLAGETASPVTYPGSYQTAVSDINNYGAMTGGIYSGKGTDITATFGFLITDTEHTELVFPPGSISSADNGLNDGKMIVGTYQDAESVSHGYLAVPLP